MSHIYKKNGENIILEAIFLYGLFPAPPLPESFSLLQDIFPPFISVNLVRKRKKLQKDFTNLLQKLGNRHFRGKKL